MTLNHLREALEHLEKAKENADLGTSMMIRPIKNELESLIERTENIENDDESV